MMEKKLRVLRRVGAELGGGSVEGRTEAMVERLSGKATGGALNSPCIRDATRQSERWKRIAN
jgi:hypothetical protein